MGKKRIDNFFIVANTNDQTLSDEFDTLEEAKEYLEEEFFDDSMEDVRVYEIVKAYSPKASGVELEEVDS